MAVADKAGNPQEVAYDPDDTEIGIVVGIPARGKVRIEWSIMLRSLQGPVNGSMCTKTVLNTPVAEARQAVAEWAIENKAKYLFFLDDDVLVPNNGIRRLVHFLDNNPDWDLVSGIYVTKTNPDQVPPDHPEPLVFGGKPESSGAFWDWKLDEVFPIWGCGMGCCLIRVEAIAKLEKPYFAWEESVDGMDAHGMGEDMYFCAKLRESGSKMYADGGLLCGHISNDGAIHSLPLESRPIQEASGEVLKRYKLYEQQKEELGKTAKRKLAGVAGSG